MNICINAWADLDRRTGHCWGDYWVKQHLKRAFVQLGHQYSDKNPDMSIDLWGSTTSMIKDRHFSHGKYKVIWYYSHPEAFRENYIKHYDLVLCLSRKSYDILKRQHRQVLYFPGCTHCRPIPSPDLKYDILLCGNTRIPPKCGPHPSKYGRWIIDHLDPQFNRLKLGLFGLRWNWFPAAQPYHLGEYWDNWRLNELYGRSRVVLSDVHREMKAKGFVPIRIFDVLGSGSLCVSCRIDGISELFGDAVVQYDSPEDLVKKVRYYLEHPEERIPKIVEGLKRVNPYTYIARAKQILRTVGHYAQF